MSKRLVVLHCSDSSWGNAAVITKWHIEKKYRTCGYHFVILNGKITNEYEDSEFDGVIETGRGLNEQGAHCKGYNDAIGICLVGEDGKFTRRQTDALIWLLKRLDMKFELDVHQHSDLDQEKFYCAGLTDEVMKEIKER